MEYDQDEQNQEGGFFNRLKESPRTVSVLIIILIVAAAIYAFSDNKNNQVDTASDTSEEMAEPSTEAQMAEPAEGGAGEESGEAMQDTAMAATPEALSPEVLSEQSKGLPEGQHTEEGYIETAQKGDGVTHMARRATTRYLNENAPGYELTNEHRIYVEDYLKDHIAKRGIKPGDQITISDQLMKDAVDAAGQLSAKQLHNLTKYTYVLQ